MLYVSRWRTKVAVACMKEKGTAGGIYMLRDAERWTSSVGKLFEEFVHISLLLCSPGAMAVSCNRLFCFLLPELLESRCTSCIHACIYADMHSKLESESHLWAQVVELKVGMHCERCIKAIKKAIKTIDGKPVVNSALLPITIPSFSFRF
jgi:hypothetical protein